MKELDFLLKKGFRFYYYIGRKAPGALEALTDEEKEAFIGLLEEKLHFVRDERKRFILAHTLGLAGAEKSTYKSVADILGITGSRVSQLAHKARMELFRAVDKKWRGYVVASC